MIVKISTPLNVPAEVVWGRVKQTATFQYVTRGVLRFSAATGLPKEWYQGQKCNSRLILFGVFPAWVHELEVVRLDNARRELQTAEKGGLLRSWDHTLTVAPDDEGCCIYTDTVVLDAGILTPLIWLIAHVFFRYRQMRLRRLVRLQEPSA